MSATNVVLGAIVAFIFTGVIANWLVQRWQYRNWLNQQRFLGAEKRYELLKSLADEISLNASKRLSSMFRLVASLALSQERVEERRLIYSNAIDDWQQNIATYYYKTTLYFDWSMTQQLEGEVNDRFVSIGAELEGLVRQKLAGEDVSDRSRTRVKDKLFALQGILGNFNRDMLHYVINQQAATYQGVKIEYNESDIQYFSTWQLFKALFITRVEEFHIVLTAFELEPPARRR